MNNSKLFVIYILCAIAISGVFFIVYKQYFQYPKKTTYENLLDSNKEFATGEAYLRSGDYENASTHFNLAIKGSSNSLEEGQIKYKVAISYMGSNDSTKAVPLFKEIVSNSKYTNIIKAYSVQQLGHMIISYNTPEIRSEVFKGEPYSTFLENADDSLARRRLFEYASSFFPLGIPELRIANWYSRRIVDLVKSGKKDEETIKKIEEMKAIIREKLLNADNYLASISSDPNASSYVPEVWYRKGNVLGDLYISGDTSFGDPEEAFKKSLQYSSVIIGIESSAKYSYALFLAKAYGNKREADIKNLLSDFYTGNRYSKTNTVKMIKGEKDNLLGNKADIVLLSGIDNNFKIFLEKLGWKFN